MRLFLLVVMAGSVLAPSAAGGGSAATYTRAGLTVTVPAGWHAVARRLTPCSNPLERITIAGRGAMVMIQESLDPRRYIERFRPRPQRFSLRGGPQPVACCAPLERAGWFFDFRDGGRGFYVYVYLGAPGTRAQALAALDSLRVSPRRRAQL